MEYVVRGLYTGIGGSVLIGLILWGISSLIFISTLIFRMIKHGCTISAEVALFAFTAVEKNIYLMGVFYRIYARLFS